MCDIKKQFEKVAAQDSRNMAWLGNAMGWQGLEDEANHNAKSRQGDYEGNRVRGFVLLGRTAGARLSGAVRVPPPRLRRMRPNRAGLSP
jgi:hypothetical protein